MTALQFSASLLEEPVAAAHLGINERSLEELRALGWGGPPYQQHGRRILYRLADLDAWAKAFSPFGISHTAPKMPRGAGRLVYSVEEAAALAHVGRTALYAAMKDGRLRFTKSGMRRLIRVAHLREFLETTNRAALANLPDDDNGIYDAPTV